MSAQHHGHPPPNGVRGDPLLVVIDPAARRIDGESVRIAKDVLCAGASTKICLPDGPAEVARALARRGSRQPVVVGDDAALLTVVRLLHQQGDLAKTVVSLIPVGASGSALTLAHTLGVPAGPVAAARTVLDGAERRLDLLVDDTGQIVLGGLWIPGQARMAAERPGTAAVASVVGPARGPAYDGGPAPGGGRRRWWAPWWRRTGGSGAVRVPDAPPVRVAARVPGVRVPAVRLRVEADGEVLADLDRPVQEIRVTPEDGLAEVVVRAGAAGPGAAPVGEVTVRAKTVTVSGSGTEFFYRSEAGVGGPVAARTWTAHAGAWRLTLPRA
ncbi:hypothetical protein [Streptomyces sp. URMC 123]|uniref:hypothetical protein n=1 Tax=Streptomyces sp. URMC 123 TaxID=3423403 RepID=UPI003F1B4B10